MNKSIFKAGIFLLSAASAFLFCGCSFLSDGTPSDSSSASSSESEISPDDSAKGDYYFDAEAATGGNGSYVAPFNTLSAIGGLSLSGGITVCLKGNFTEPLLLDGVHGEEGAPVVITNYGGDYAKIDGQGNTSADTGIVTLRNCSYITVENLEITDTTQQEGDRRSVLVTASGKDGEIVTYSKITLQDLYIHDVKGIVDEDKKGMSAESKKTGGIQVWTSDGMGRFDGLTIEGCKIENVDNVGIATWYKAGITAEYKISPYTSNFSAHAFTNVAVCGNEISGTGKNGIFVRNLLGGVIEHNTVYNTNRTCFSGNSICTSYVDGTVVQFNEGYSNNARTDGNGDLADGCMLDADLQSKDTVWQYNYSHDNAFGLFESCTDARDNVIVRFNLSVADRGKKGIVYLNYASNKVEIYNNTIVTLSSDSPVILQTNENHSRTFSFFNNVIYNSSEGAKVKAVFSDAEVECNLIYNNGTAKISYSADDLTEKNLNGVYSSPLFAGRVPTDLLARTGFSATAFAKVKGNSPALHSGRVVSGVTQDFFGNDYSASIGCCAA
jgi:hypothetical protein